MYYKNVYIFYINISYIYIYIYIYMKLNYKSSLPSPNDGSLEPNRYNADFHLH